LAGHPIFAGQTVTGSECLFRHSGQLDKALWPR